MAYAAHELGIRFCILLISILDSSGNLILQLGKKKGEDGLAADKKCSNKGIPHYVMGHTLSPQCSSRTCTHTHKHASAGRS